MTFDQIKYTINENLDYVANSDKEVLRHRLQKNSAEIDNILDNLCECYDYVFLI